MAAWTTMRVGLFALTLLGGCLSSGQPPADGSPAGGPTDPWMAACQQAREASNPGGNWSSESVFPTVDGRPCNVFQDGNATLYAALIPEQTLLVQALRHGGGLDWVYIASDGSVRLLEAGSGSPVTVKASWPEPLVPGGQRTFAGMAAVWAGETLHVVLETYFTYPYPLPAQEEHTWHLWFDGVGHDEQLPDPEPGRFRSRCLGICSTLATDGTEAAFIATEPRLTDYLQATEDGVAKVWISEGGAFRPPIERRGVIAPTIAGREGTFFACGMNATSYLVAQSPDWAFQGLHSAPLGGQCHVAVGDDPHVLTWGLPLIGGNGNGGGGSGDETDYRIWSRVNGSWDDQELGRSPWSGVGFAATATTPFFTDDSRDGSHSTELWMLRNGTWAFAWGQDGPYAHVVDGFDHPVVWAYSLQNPWGYDGLAAMRFDRL